MKYRMRRVQWLAIVGMLVGLGACDDSQPANGSTCTPACRTGYTCVGGACVSACNPACGASEQCVADATGARCTAITPGTDSGLPGTDATSQSDTPATMDVVVTPTDVPPGTDVQTPPSDNPVVTADAGDAATRAPCGATGQPCCNTTSCTGANLCNNISHVCEAYTPEAGECTTTGTCPSGQVCTYAGAVCAGGTRVCLRCLAAPAGGMPAGSACGGTMPVNCATGICANNLCTRTCVPGPEGDAACRAADPQTSCAELRGRALVDGGVGPIAVYGACIRSCHRDADCTNGQKCGLSRSDITDTLIQVCRNPFGAIASGAVCPLSPVPDAGRDDPAMYCQSEQCFGTAPNTYCAAFCATDADCPGSTYACMEVPFFRPSNLGTVPIRMCQRR